MRGRPDGPSMLAFYPRPGSQPKCLGGSLPVLLMVGSGFHWVFAIRPRLRGALTPTTTFSMVADLRHVVYEPLTCSVRSIANDVHCGSYLDFILLDFRKFAGRDSRSIPPVLR